MKRAILGSLVLSLTLGLCTSANATNFNSTIAIGKAIPLYHGKVRARTQSFCEPDRRVVLFEKVSGPDTKIGKATTDEKGKWTIEVPVEHLMPGQKYYAFVRSEDLGNEIFCEKAISDVVTFVGG